MSKILLTADLHFGCPGKTSDIVWSLEIMTKYAQKNNIKEIMILGDLFHDRVNLKIDVLVEVFKFFSQDRGIRFMTFCGNHDMFLKNSWSINSLKPLGNLINVIEDVSAYAVDNRRFWIVPFIYYENDYMDTINKISKNVSSDDILLTHIGVNGASLNECFLLKNWSYVDFNDSKFNKIISGHFHCHQQVNKVYYPGSPIPFRFDEGVVDHGFLILDTDTANLEFINIREIAKEFSDYLPPDYITISDEDVVDNIELCKNNHIRVLINEDKTSNQILEIKNKIREIGAINVSHLIPKKEDNIIKQVDIKSTNNADLFVEYIEHDKPELDFKLLTQLHGIIKTEAEQRHVVEEVDDA